MDFRILGPLEVRDGERQLALGGARQRALLGLLLVHANEAVSSDRLLDELWGSADASKALQVAVSRLRKVIGPDALVTRPPGYELRVEPGELDLHRFEALVGEGRTALSAGDAAAAHAALAEALELWRGPPLSDISFEASLQPELSRLEELRLAALEDRVEAELAMGHHAEIVGELEALTAEHPLRERPRGQLMLALYRSGRQAEALDVYRDTRRALVDELGIEPSRALRDLEQAILSQDAALEPRSTSDSAKLIGRARELRQLLPLVRKALAGDGAMILIAGEPGIGKSQLADVLSDEARECGARVLIGRCWEAGGAPAYWPWTQALRACLRDTDPAAVRTWAGRGGSDLAAMLPELRDVLPELPAPQSESSGARFRVFEAFASFLRRAAAAQPLAIGLDDVHAADPSSVLLLRFIADELAGAPILIVGCYRDSEVGPELAEALPQLTRSAVVQRVSLTGLDRPETARLLAQVAGAAISDELVARIYEETDGNPLFAGEVARLLASEGSGEGPAKLPVPEGVREAIGRRLKGMSAPCRQALDFASVLGREFDVDALEQVSGLGRDELDSALEEGMSARLVGELPDRGGRLRFAHMLIRDAVYEELPATRRLRLHLEVGEALEALYGGNLEPHFAELAHHYLLAGPPGEARAIRFSAAAGDRSASQLAYEEAVRQYQIALDLLESGRLGDDRKTCELLLSLGDVLHRSGNGSDAKMVLRRAADIADRNGWAEPLAQAAFRYGGRFAWARSSTDPALVPLLERALSAVGDADSPARAGLLGRLASARRDDADPEFRTEIATEAVEVAERTGDLRALAAALEGYWLATEVPDTVHEVLRIGERLIPIAEQLGDKELLFAARDHRLNALWSLARRDALDVELGLLCALAEDLRQPAQWWSARLDMTILALMEGRFEDAERLIAEAAVLGGHAERWNAAVSERLALFVLRREQGRLAELEGTIRRSVHEFPTLLRFRCALAHLYAELGRKRDTAAVLEELFSRDLATEHLDSEWLFSMSLLPDACVYAADEAACAELYALLLPYRDRYTQAPIEACFGSVARGLGVLAARLECFDEAEDHFNTALEVERSMRARPWLAHAQHDMASMLLARGESARANDLLSEAVATYRELGMETWAQRAEALA